MTPTIAIAGVFTALVENALAPILLLILILFLPISNAVLDWLSLGITRGLLLHIPNGNHRILSTLRWALADILLALILLTGVAVSSFIAYLLAVSIAHDRIYYIFTLQR